MHIQRFCSPLFLAVLLTSVAFGQGVATGDQRISVKDPQGENVTNATVVARDQAKGIERAASANGVGEYSLVALPPASYTVTISAPGFSRKFGRVAGDADDPESHRDCYR